MVMASIIGIWWVRKDGLAGMSPREAGIYLVLAVFLGAAFSRRLFGQRGKRHAIVILVGFGVLLLTNLSARTGSPADGQAAR